MPDKLDFQNKKSAFISINYHFTNTFMTDTPEE